MFQKYYEVKDFYFEASLFILYISVRLSLTEKGVLKVTRM